MLAAAVLSLYGRDRATGTRAPVAQLDRVLPSEGRGQRFESSRVRQFFSRSQMLEISVLLHNSFKNERKTRSVNASQIDTFRVGGKKY